MGRPALVRAPAEPRPRRLGRSGARRDQGQRTGHPRVHRRLVAAGRGRTGRVLLSRRRLSQHAAATRRRPRRAARLYLRLPELIPDEKPSLLHGDLWNGNFLVNKNGTVSLIDPAVYYGHRETDLAMAKLFGGFDNAFYESYHEAFPLAPGFH